MSDVTGNLVGLSGNVLYKFEALVGGILLVFGAFQLTPDLSVARCRAPRCRSPRFEQLKRAPCARFASHSAGPTPYSPCHVASFPSLRITRCILFASMSMLDFYFLLRGDVLLFHVFLCFLRSSACVVDDAKCPAMLEVVEYCKLFTEH